MRGSGKTARLPDRSAEGFMRRALQLARRARERTWPNPMVGALVLKRGRVVGEGYHRRAGLAHAEVVALDRAAGSARGGDLFVTLEPCHRTGRTGPCTERILAAGIRRVFVGTQDPNPAERGRGIAVLRRAGIDVEVGILERECRELNEVYNVFIKGLRPFVILKAASSLDGRIATRSGDSRWISSEPARTYAHRLRSHAGAVLVGARTVKVDDPRLDVRHVPGRNPAVAVLDARLALSPRARIFKLKRYAPVIVYTSNKAPLRAEQHLIEAGASVVRVAERRGRLSLRRVLADLLARGVFRLLVEGGSEVMGSFFSNRLVDRLEVIVTGRILGSAGVPLLSMAGPTRVAKAPRIDSPSWKKLGPDMCCSGKLEWPR